MFSSSNDSSGSLISRNSNWSNLVRDVNLQPDKSRKDNLQPDNSRKRRSDIPVEVCYNSSEEIKKKFINYAAHPMTVAGNAKIQGLPTFGNHTSKFLNDEGPLAISVARRAANRAGLVQPPYDKMFKLEHMELLGILANTYGIQTSCFITLLLDLVLICLPPGSTFDTQMGQSVNFNFFRIFVGETCSHKSRLIKICIENAIVYLKRHGLDIGLFTGDFTKTDLLEHMKKNQKKSTIIVDDEVGLRFQKLKTGNRKDMYDQTRINMNVLNDGGGIHASFDQKSSHDWKFALVAATQMLPCLQLMQNEKSSGDALTKKFKLTPMPTGKETGDYGPKLHGASPDSFIYGLVFTLVTAFARKKFPVWKFSELAMILYSQYIEEKTEFERSVNERNILIAMGLVDNSDNLDDDLDKFRDEKNVIQFAVAHFLLCWFLDLCFERQCFFTKGRDIGTIINVENLQNGIISQRVAHCQREEIKVTLDTLDNLAGSLVTFAEADKILTVQDKAFSIVKSVLLCPGWLVPVKYIWRLHAVSKIKSIEVISEMKNMSVPFGTFNFSGIFVECNRSKGYVKCHPYHIDPLFLLQLGMNINDYEAAFYKPMLVPPPNLNPIGNWLVIVKNFAKKFPIYPVDDVWFHNFRRRFIEKEGQNIIELKDSSPVPLEAPTVNRKELLICERIRGLELCTVEQRIERIRIRLQCYYMFEKSLNQAHDLTKHICKKHRNALTAHMRLFDRVQPELQLEFDNYGEEMVNSLEKLNQGLAQLKLYQKNQQDLLRNFVWLEDRRKRGNLCHIVGNESVTGPRNEEDDDEIGNSVPSSSNTSNLRQQDVRTPNLQNRMENGNMEEPYSSSTPNLQRAEENGNRDETCSSSTPNLQHRIIQKRNNKLPELPVVDSSFSRSSSRPRNSNSSVTQVLLDPESTEISNGLSNNINRSRSVNNGNCSISSNNSDRQRRHSGPLIMPI